MGKMDRTVAETGQTPVEKAGVERRAAARDVMVLVNAGIAQEGRTGLCRIRSLSDGGMKVETRLPLTVNADVTIQLRSGKILGGNVRWIGQGRAGIALDAGSVASVLYHHAQAQAEPGQSAFPRFVRHAEVSIRTQDHRRHRCHLTSVSLTDMIVTGADTVLPDAVVTIAIDGLGEHLARVDHVQDGEALLAFAQPLHYRRLEGWLQP